jgi:hypothetical protein
MRPGLLYPLAPLASHPLGTDVSVSTISEWPDNSAVLRRFAIVSPSFCAAPTSGVGCTCTREEFVAGARWVSGFVGSWEVRERCR